MKKVINKKRYDTDTAEKLAYYTNNGDDRDLYWIAETLYRKTTGEYFLYGEGNAGSCYAVHSGQNSWSGGEQIIPLTYDDATEWAEKHLDGEEYEAIFGAVEDDGNGEKTRVTLTLPTAQAETLRREASAQGKSLPAYITEILDGVKVNDN